MPDYRRNRIAGGPQFFMVNLLDRRSTLLVSEVGARRDAVRETRLIRPLHIDAWGSCCRITCTVQRRYRKHRIRDDADYAAHMDYIIYFNPVKHGVAEHPAAWPFSGFRHCVAQGTYPEEWAVADVSLVNTGERLHRAMVG